MSFLVGEASLMNEHGIYNSHQLMGSGDDGLFIGQALISSFREVCFKHFVEPYGHNGHNPYNPSYMSVSPLGEFTFPFISSRLIDSGIKPCIGDEFPYGLESFDVPYLTEEIHGRCLSYPLYGCEDIYISLKFTLFKHLSQGFIYLFHFLHEEYEKGGLLGEDEFLSGMTRCDGCPCKFYDVLFGDVYLSPSVIFHGPSYILSRCLSYAMSGGESGYEVKDGYAVDIHLLLEFGEGEEQEFFHIVLYPSDFAGYMFPLPYEVLQFGGDDVVVRYGFMKHLEKQGNCSGIFFVRFCPSQRHLHKVSHEEGIYNTAVISGFCEEGKEVDVVATGGFFTYEDLFPLEDREFIHEGCKSVSVHAEQPLKDDVLILIDDTREEGILGDIDTDEEIIWHSNTSMIDFLAMAGDASQPILHDDKGLLTQPTYHGFWRQVTDSLEDFSVQVKCSYPALPHGYCTGYTRLYTEDNILS